MKSIFSANGKLSSLDRDIKFKWSFSMAYTGSLHLLITVGTGTRSLNCAVIKKIINGDHITVGCYNCHQCAPIAKSLSHDHMTAGMVWWSQLWGPIVSLLTRLLRKGIVFRMVSSIITFSYSWSIFLIIITSSLSRTPWANKISLFFFSLPFHFQGLINIDQALEHFTQDTVL